MSSADRIVSLATRAGSSRHDATLPSPPSVPSFVVATNASQSQLDPCLAFQDEVFGKSGCLPIVTDVSLAGLRARRQHLLDAEDKQRGHFEGLRKELIAICRERHHERGARPDLPVLVCDRRPLVKTWSKQGCWLQKVHRFRKFLLSQLAVIVIC